MNTYSANATLAYALGKTSTWNSGTASQGAAANGQPRDGLILFSNLRSAVKWSDMTVSEVRLWVKFGTAGASARKTIGFYTASRSSVGGIGNDARGSYIGDVYTSTSTYGANETIYFNENTNSSAFANLKKFIEEGTTTGLCIFKNESGGSTYTTNFLNITSASIQIDYDLRGSTLSVSPTTIEPATDISFDISPIETSGTLTHVLRAIVDNVSSDIASLAEGVVEYELSAPSSWFTGMQVTGLNTKSIIFALDTYVDSNLQGTKEVNATLSVTNQAKPSINIFTPRRYGSYIDDQGITQYQDDLTGTGLWADISISVNASAAPDCDTADVKLYWWPSNDDTQRSLLATLLTAGDISNYALTHSAGMFGQVTIPIADNYTFELVVDNGYFVVSAQATVSKSWAPLHVSGTGYGVGVGMFSKGTEQNPSFDVGWNSHFYGDVQIDGNLVGADTGWINLGTASGVNANQGPGITGVNYRVINGNHVYISAYIGLSSNWTSSKVLNANALPEDFRPTANVYRLGVVGGRYMCRSYVGTDGLLRLEWVQNIASSSQTSSAAVSWTDIWVDYFV